MHPHAPRIPALLTSRTLPRHLPRHLPQPRPVQPSRGPRHLHLRTTTPHRQSQTQSRSVPNNHHPDDFVRLDSLDPRKIHSEDRRRQVGRLWALSAKAIISGSLAGFLCLFLKWELDARADENGNTATRTEGPPLPVGGLEIVGKPVVVVEKHGRREGQHVPTGTSTVPGFPKSLYVAEGMSQEQEVGEEYTLLGLGVRTVSFLSIEVYVVGLYVALADAPALQKALLRLVEPSGLATTATQGERERLHELLLDPVKGEEAVDRVLREGGFRSVFRIVPVKNTDMAHMRDGWVRGITAKSQEAGHRSGAGKEKKEEGVGGDEFDGEDFGKSMKRFREMLSTQEARRKVPTGRELLLLRDGKGALRVTLGGDRTEAPCLIGEITDERIGRCVWLNYMAGKKVASEGARRSMVNGLLELVERPVGTVETKVE